MKPAGKSFIEAGGNNKLSAEVRHLCIVPFISEYRDGEY
jgi:hypothetical protein